MDPYEDISESIDEIILDARRNQLSADDTRKVLFAAMTLGFSVLNRIENVEPKLYA